MTIAIEMDEIQGNVLYAYGVRYGYAHYARLRIRATRTDEARRVIGTWMNYEVTFGRRAWAPPGTPHVNIAFTCEGLRAMGVPENLLAYFPKEFRVGARECAEALGDRWQEDPGDDSMSFGGMHVLLSVHATSREGARDKLKVLLTAGADDLFEALHIRAAGVLERPGGQPRRESCGTEVDREHFGFADGCSQPAVEGVDTDPVGDGVFAVPEPEMFVKFWRKVGLWLENVGWKPLTRRWRFIRAGEFVLGYRNEDGEIASGPPAPLGPNGTYVVYREMEQYVGRFNAYLDEHAEDPWLPRDKLGAIIIGRWPDGTPLSLDEHDGDHEIYATSRRRSNNFLYAETRYGYEADPAGHKCPLGAHVRRSNPRDALPGGAERTARHRIIRRGLPFGDRWEKGGCDRGRGLAFVCYAASLANGFEFIQREWINAGRPLGLLGQRDFLLQEPKGASDDDDDDDDGSLRGMVIQRPSGPKVLPAPKQPFVRVIGCEYAFVPSRRACAWLTTLPASA